MAARFRPGWRTRRTVKAHTVRGPAFPPALSCAETWICRCSSAWRPEGLLLLDPGAPAQASASLNREPNFQDLHPEDWSAALVYGPSWGIRSSRPALPAAFPREGFGAASRKRQMPLPAPLPGWPRRSPEGDRHCRPAEIGSSVPSSLAIFPREGLPLLETGTSVPITHVRWTHSPSRESEIARIWPVDNVDIAHKSWRNSARCPRASHPPLVPRVQ